MTLSRELENELTDAKGMSLSDARHTIMDMCEAFFDAGEEPDEILISEGLDVDFTEDFLSACARYDAIGR